MSKRSSDGPATMRSKPRILFAMITVGEGHRSSALAGKAWLERTYPHAFDVDVVDFSLAVGDVGFDRRHKKAWRDMLRSPWTAYVGQRLLDTIVPPSWSRFVQSKLVDRQARLAATWLGSHDYDLVVATHFFPAHALALARERYGVTVPYVVVNPDVMDAHVLWSAAGAEAYCVFSVDAREDLVRFGIPAARVRVFDPLLRPEFDAPCGDAVQRRSRDALGLRDDALNVLWSAGGEGIGGRMVGTVADLEKRRCDIDVVALCGRNESLRRSLDSLSGTLQHVHLHPFGYRDDVASLLCTADLFVGKAGPASTFEALVSGTPVVHTGFAGANEKAVSDYVVANGFGTRARDADDVTETLASFARDRRRLAATTDRIVAAKIANGGRDWAAWLVETLFADDDSVVATAP